MGVLAPAAVLLAGCTSSSAPAKAPPSGPETSAASTSVSAAPTSATPSTSASSAKPLSAFEQDPAVQGARAFFAQAGRTINTGHVIDDKLRALVTPYVASQMKQVTGPDVGTYYPGPAPFQPTGVVASSAANKTISGCLEANGWAQNPKTHKPAHPRQIAGVKVNMLDRSGRWLVNGLVFTKSVSCSGVTVRTQTW